MTAKSILLLRHGRTEYNASRRLQGQVDIPLDAVGRWQVEQGTKALLEVYRADRVISSDLGRALDTATPYAEELGVAVEPDPRLRERNFGAWEGLRAEEIEARWPEQAAVWRAGGEPEREGAEAKTSVEVRMVEAITEVACSMDDDATLLVVSHGAAIAIAITGLLGLDASNWRGITGLDNVHWSRLRRSAPGATPDWHLTAHNQGPAFPRQVWNAGPERTAR